MQSEKHWIKFVSFLNCWGIDLNILLTRALTQVKPLKNLVSQCGYQPILFPTLEIEPLNNTPRKTHYDALIFISVNAVEHALDILKNLTSKNCKIFAVGAATANKLNEYGFKVDAFPSKKASSEALLAMPEIGTFVNKDILIFRGKGGRETLKEGLKVRNIVEYVEVYQRVICDATPLHRSSLLAFLQNDQGIIIATSVENLRALLLIIEQIDASKIAIIKYYPLVVLSERIKIFAKSEGFTQVEVATKTSNEGIFEVLIPIADCTNPKTHHTFLSQKKPKTKAKH